MDNLPPNQIYHFYTECKSNKVKLHMRLIKTVIAIHSFIPVKVCMLQCM